ncbi:MAG TPA: ribosome silencing factor [Lachnospiraceae bacterium]|nr:ribosome silencing factor [Lachnospiraceae bacterium]
MEKTESRKLAAIAAAALEEKKADNVKIIEIDGISPLADYFVLASGNNTSQTEAMVDNVEEKAAKAGFMPDHIEGHRNANWTLLDYKGVVVHVFDEEARSFYDLDRIWKDGKSISPDELQQ